MDSVVSESEAWGCDPVRCVADLRSVPHAEPLSAVRTAVGRGSFEGAGEEVNLNAVPCR
jgi:hypothetical protein